MLRAAREGHAEEARRPAAGAAARRDLRPQMAAERARPGLHSELRTWPLGRLLDRRGQRHARALDGKRNRRPERGKLERARADPLEILRRPRHLRLPLPAAQPLQRAAAGDLESSWRTASAAA